MSYYIETGHPDGRAFHWWASFLAYSGWMQSSDLYNLQDVLDQHNSKARLDPSTFHVGDRLEFETEHDATVFILKWS